MNSIEAARYQLEFRAEVTVNYLRLFLIVVFSIAVALSYINRILLPQSLPFFVAGISSFVLTASLSILLLRLGRFRASYKYYFS
ncbi:MAG: hypothetical protein RIF32_22500, partial [Leptospirales bacterium]